MTAMLPEKLEDEDTLDALLSHPGADLVADLAALDGDIMVLGASGKMGPTLARLARHAAPQKRVFGVARFADAAQRSALEAHGIETISADLLDRSAIAGLPQARNIVFMAGFKFGARNDAPLTWAMNVHAPALVAEAFASSRMAVFSTGCVYPFTAIGSGGATEATPPDPPGEYAMTCLGRERIFAHFSRKLGIPGRLLRLNYAIDLRYGVLHDIALAVRAREPIDLSMGHVNVIWQGDACAQALRSLRHGTIPATPLNISGPETLSVRWLAQELGQRMGLRPIFTGEEAAQSWLNNASQAAGLFGYPGVPLPRMLDWVADWVAAGRRSFGKPTGFGLRSGDY